MSQRSYEPRTEPISFVRTSLIGCSVISFPSIIDLSCKVGDKLSQLLIVLQEWMELKSVSSIDLNCTLPRIIVPRYGLVDRVILLTFHKSIRLPHPLFVKSYKEKACRACCSSLKHCDLVVGRTCQSIYHRKIGASRRYITALI